MPRWGLTPRQGGPGPRRAELPARVGQVLALTCPEAGPGWRLACSPFSRGQLRAEHKGLSSRLRARLLQLRFLAHSPHPQLNRQEGPRGAQGGPGTTPSRPTAERLKQGAPPMRGAPATVFSIPQMGPGPALQTEEAELSHGVPAAARGEAGLLPRGVSSGHRLVAEPRAGAPWLSPSRQSSRSSSQLDAGPGGTEPGAWTQGLWP